MHELFCAHVMEAARLHGDDTTVPLPARDAAKEARLWICVCDDRPFTGIAALAALYHFSVDCKKTHSNSHLAGWKGTLQAHAYNGYNDLYLVDQSPRPIKSALCWSHAHRKFFELADITADVRKGKPDHEISQVALDALSDIEPNIREDLVRPFRVQ